MQIDSRAASALFPKTKGAVLALLFGRPEESFYLREIARIVDQGMGSVQREVEKLTDAGLLRRSKQGNHVYYQANAESPVYEAVHMLVRQTLGIPQLISKALQPLQDRIDLAFIFGSISRGEERDESDVDLFIVGDVSLMEVVSALRKGGEGSLQREVNPVIYKSTELRDKYASGNQFVTAILKEQDLVFLIGDHDDLRELAGSGMDSEARS